MNGSNVKAYSLLATMLRGYYLKGFIQCLVHVIMTCFGILT